MKIHNQHARPTVAVHKFSSCDGCQLAFLNAGVDLLALTELVDIKHFVEAGPMDVNASVDIAFVEGSISTHDEVERIQKVRENSRYLITIGACATSGGLQALRNLCDSDDWVGSIYTNPEYIDSLPAVSPIAQHVRVDYELWGCPVSSQQILTVIRSLLYGVVPVVHDEALCLTCKRAGNVCTLVAKGSPCMGAVTKTGCGALCPSYGRDCYGCYGPAENQNANALINRFTGLGLVASDIARRFQHICNASPENRDAVKTLGQCHE